MSQIKLGLYALTVELAALYQALLGGSDQLQLLKYFAAHGVACALLALMGWATLPARLKNPRVPIILLIFGFSFAVPVLGFAATFVSLLVLPRLPDIDPHPPFRSVPLPALDPFQRISKGIRRSGLRNFLDNARVPVTSRMKALVSLQKVPGRVSTPLLRHLLTDPTEDLRLLAYGLLDGHEKKLNDAIHQELAEVESPNAVVKAMAHRRLSSIYWELVYQNLAQGDLRTHALEESLRHTRAVLRLLPGDAGMYLQFGRLLHEMGQIGEAVPVYEAALAAGIPPQRVLPYLAEIAYDRRDYGMVRNLMQRLRGWEHQSRLQPVIDYWSPA